MLKLDLTRAARRFVDDLPPKQFRQVVNKVLALMDDPEPADSLQLKGQPFRRADIGEYRIVYRVEADCLRVALIGKRNDGEVYRKLR